VAINLIVLAITILMAAFVGVWIYFPRLRTWMERPKYRFLEQQQRYPGVLRAPQQEDPNSLPPSGRTGVGE
jgi:hypothetical protein